MSAHRDSHLSPGMVAGFLDGMLTADERARAEAHLVDCDECREELVAAGRIVRKRPSVRRVWLFPIGAAAAALLVAIGVRAPRPGTADESPTRERPAPASEGISVLAAVHPAGDAVLVAAPHTFTWRSAGPDATYRLTLADATGGTIWTSTNVDTTVTLPSSVSLAPGRYYWYVDAQRTDGVSTSTGALSLTIR